MNLLPTLLLASIAGAAPSDYKAASPLAGGYRVQWDCSAVRDVYFSFTKKWEEDFMRGKIYTCKADGRPDFAGCGPRPAVEGRLTHVAEEPGSYAIAGVSGSDRFRGKLQISEAGSRKRLVTFRVTAPDLPGFRVEGTGTLTRGPNETTALWTFVDFKARIIYPAAMRKKPESCGGRGAKHTFLALEDGGIYDPDHAGKTPPR
jgi:hypothetical protein